MSNRFPSGFDAADTPIALDPLRPTLGVEGVGWPAKRDAQPATDDISAEGRAGNRRAEFVHAAP